MHLKIYAVLENGHPSFPEIISPVYPHEFGKKSLFRKYLEFT